MNIDYSFFKVSDGQSLAYKQWNKAENPKGVVILVHGMAEHIERYDGFASYLNNNGFIVYGTDHRGHGKTSGKKGLFTYNQGWKRVVDDQFEFYNFVKGNHPDLKISYMGHSMGSYISRALISLHDLDIDRIILSGTGHETGLKAAVGRVIARVATAVRGAGQDAVLIDKMVNGPFAASVKNPLTAFDWLSRDAEEVAKYINDTNCGYICSNKFYKDFFNIVGLVCSKSNMKKIKKDLPILLYSGSDDPVGGKNACNVKKLYKIYKSLGLDATIMINEGGRHENLNETNKDEVYKAFLDFFNGSEA